MSLDTELAPADLDTRLDALSAQVAEIAAELRAQAARREQWAELTEVLVPISKDAMALASDELAELSQDVDIADVAELARTLARAVPQLQAALAQLTMVTELAETMTHLSGPALAKLTETLAAADEKGYFTFARSGAALADTVVAEVSDADLAAMGEHLPAMLAAVKELTQPQVMVLLQRIAVTLRQVQATPMTPPSLFALGKSMRDPQTRVGLARLVSLLHTIGE